MRVSAFIRLYLLYVTILTITHSLCLIGISPVDDSPPALHCPVHYGGSARIFGILLWYWLMTFERYNKKIKNLVGNKNHPISSLANALVKDAGRLLFLSTPSPSPPFLRIHICMHVASQYRRWMTDPDAYGHSRMRQTRVLTKGRKWVPSFNFAANIASLCTCCSNMQTRNSCTDHRTAMVDGVKVCHIQHIHALTHAHDNFA